MSEEVKELSMFDDLSKRIKNVASKLDLILYSVPTKKDSQKELIEDVVTLQCFHLAVFREPSPIFENYLIRIEKNKQTERKKKERKDSGSFFTPPFIADFIVKSAIGPLTDKIASGRKATRPETKLRKLFNLKICDPAVGGGIFLVSAHDHLMMTALDIKPDLNLKEYSRRAAKCLFGVDINPDAVAGCKLALNLNIAKWELKKEIEEFVKTVA